MDNPKKRKQDAKLISLDQPHEKRWAKRLGVSPERLREAVKAVGHSVAKVRAYLGR